MVASSIKNYSFFQDNKKHEVKANPRIRERSERDRRLNEVCLDKVLISKVKKGININARWAGGIYNPLPYYILYIIILTYVIKLNTYPFSLSNNPKLNRDLNE